MKWVNYRKEAELAHVGLNLPVSGSIAALRLPLWFTQPPKWMEDFCTRSQVFTRHRWEVIIGWKWHNLKRPPYFRMYIFDGTVGDPLGVITHEQIQDGCSVSMVAG